ncbi:helix-turn-helix domain-containing protein [Halorarius litoreus]|uniref:helix-turn-helix domain-containing protein n=1 Tax=Halorarius litoreus TaxID=2962676 RepID=UPI0020CC59DD|nr:helix-turn-helix domain-containing protein [Halorarius litoreus]
MTVIAELTLEPGDFPLGRLSVQDPQMRIELERLVPANSELFPFFWAHGGDFERFEQRVRALDIVTELVALDRVEDTVLYRIQWGPEVENFVGAIAETGAVILEAHGNDRWQFRLRYPDHRGLTAFHNYCQEHDVPFHLERVYTLAEDQQATYNFGLTNEQRAALLIAVEDGYFRIPRETTMAEIAAELDISEQSASERIRRGIDTLARKILLTRSADDL